ncbi:wlm [Cordyceps fumosorosea ARSEF 2679]|uniref:Wlm n=1 Tax=Cordyceps fumosorosea (strain ARSEF 2679) TaxID=1081104 RepID=A0A168EIM5_CORFA|nr:wlm [Cordyceps fumosorosea ARSEF 2679]OAA73853.1 wlm [Cordyceps fumosorosea ARSEF 2679]
MVNQDQQVWSYVHLARLPRADDALQMLRRVASAVKPIMRNHQWRVGELAEFYPNNANLLGLNVNRGQQICLRLRYANDQTLFLGLDMVIDTMLHELCHNVHGPHNADFHALWEALRDEHLRLTLSGYSGASFLSRGRRLGGGAPAGVSVYERGRVMSNGVVAVAGRRLGGGGGGAAGRPAALTPEMRRAAAAEAAERRKRALEGCGASTLDEAQIRDAGATARRNGFRTQAEEDKANDAAIAQALAELMGDARDLRPGPANRSPPVAARNRLLATVEQQGTSRGRRRRHGDARGGADDDAGWVCPVCTLHNPGGYLCCDACRSERRLGEVIDLT